MQLTEDNLAEQPALEWFRELGYEVAFGPEISPGGTRPERDSFDQVVLVGRLQKALARLNSHLPADAIDDTFRQLLHLDSPNLVANNKQFHFLVREEVKINLGGSR